MPLAILGLAIGIIQEDPETDSPAFTVEPPHLQAALPLHEVQFLEYTPTASATPTCIAPLQELGPPGGQAAAAVSRPRGQALPDDDDANPEPLPVPPVPPLPGLRQS